MITQLHTFSHIMYDSHTHTHTYTQMRAYTHIHTHKCRKDAYELEMMNEFVRDYNALHFPLSLNAFDIDAKCSLSLSLSPPHTHSLLLSLFKSLW